MPVESDTVDVVISNCVINLSPDKDKVFAEAFRVLRRGGKLAVSDMVLTGKLEADELERFKTWASCVGGAVPLDEYTGKMKAAGFEDIKIESKHTYTKEELAYMVSEPSGCGCGGDARVEGLKDMANGRALSQVATVKITARKK
ncbi:MAG TPA: methyltransferase domain-containing protein, partial [Methanocella sp.]|nr:methyltransferase domain-containing protein [Methanocella sp.]